MLSLLASSSPAQEGQDQTSPSINLKSEKKAMTLSLVGTLASLAMFLPFGLREGHDPGGLNGGEAIALVGALALPVGPALGYFYTGATGRGFLGIGLRLLGIAGMVGGGFGLNGSGEETLMKVFIVGGACVTVASTIYDFATLKKTVRRHNLKAKSMQMAVAPVVLPKSRTYGLQFQLSF
jgi:hypothetical protein